MLRGGGGGHIWIALSEALYWVAALDDWAKSPDEESYFKRRALTPEGRTVGGLVFARNAHAHELVTAGEAEFEMGTPVIRTGPEASQYSGGGGTLFTVRFKWVALEKLTARDKNHGRDRMYDERVAGRLLTEPFKDAVAWFEAMIAGSGPSRSLP
jgi:hypothetical protein